MAKAKRKTKAQKIQRRNTAAQPQSVQAVTQSPVVATAAPAVKLSTLDAARIGHVSSDVRRIAIMTVIFIAAQFALAYLMNHTDFGTSIYDSIHVGS